MIEASPWVYACPRLKGKMSFFDISHLDFYGEFLVHFLSIDVLPFFEGLQHFDDSFCILNKSTRFLEGISIYISV